MSVVANEVRPARASWTWAGVVASPAFFWVVLAVYLVAHVALRLWETPNIGKNDVQEAVAAQGWAWGYHPRNPPLHTWLLMSSYSVFGVGLLAHAVLKYVLLGATYTFAYFAGRRLLSSQTLAALSALSLTLLAPFAWTVHTALTHTLLLAAVNLATLWAALRLTEKRRTLDYLVFGAVIGLGLLTKYSYALFFLPLIAAMLTQTTLRRALLDWRMVLALAVAGLMYAPHGLWMATARFDFVGFLTEKQQSATPQPYLVDLVSGVGSVVAGVLTFLAPLILVAAGVVLGARSARASDASPWARATALTLAFSVGLLLLDVLVLRATQFEQRYFLCALILAPLVLFQWLERREATGKGWRWFGIGLASVIVIAAGGLIGRGLLEHRSCNRCWEEMPVAELDRAVRAAGFQGGMIVADHYNLAGNMRLRFSQSRTVAANYEIPRAPLAGTGQCLLVWNARVAGEAMPAALGAYIARRGLTPAGGPHYAEALLLRDSERMDRFAYWLVPNADGDCRPS